MSSIALGYAQALLLAAEPDVQKQIADELFALDRIISAQRSFFLSPRVTTRELVAVFKDSLSGGVHPLTLNFVCLLASRRLLNGFHAIQLYFDDLVTRSASEAKVRLRVPYEPSEELVGEIRTYLANTGLLPEDKGEAAKLNVMLDQSLIGGFYAEYGGRVLDASLKTWLDKANPQWRQGAK